MDEKHKIQPFTFSSTGNGINAWMAGYLENVFLEPDHPKNNWEKFEDTFLPVQSLTVGTRTVKGDGSLTRPIEYCLSAPMEVISCNVLMQGDLSINNHPIPEGGLFFLDYQKPFSLTTQGGYTEYSIYIPDLALPHPCLLSAYHGLTLRGTTSAFLSQFIRTIVENSGSFDQSDVTRLGAMVRETAKLSIGKLIAQLPPQSHQSARPKELRKIEQVRNYIRDHIQERTLSPASIGKDLAIPARELGLLFKPPYGSLSRYIKARRLKVAHLNIEQAASQIKAIAYDLSFTNLASFSRTFKAAFGYTPAQAYEFNPKLSELTRFTDVVDRPRLVG